MKSRGEIGRQQEGKDLRIGKIVACLKAEGRTLEDRKRLTM